jgi:probable rRNA maturation factor
MRTAKIFFFTEDIRFVFRNKAAYKKWLQFIATSENAAIKNLTLIFCSDNYLLDINRQYLNRAYFTDVIAFDLERNSDGVFGEIYISIDRVRENATQYGFSFDQELSRVMAHGLLHLLGYRDSNKAKKLEMTTKEDYYLAMLSGFIPV